jgi:3-isopropylmalate/(R)-2-methylmalate dehydratase large subunit
VPDPSSFASPAQQQAAQRALTYMGLEAGTAIRDIPVDVVFIGSCTNGRLPDLRSAADGDPRPEGQPRRAGPGGARLRPEVKAEAEAEGLDRVFTDAGFEWRSAGCSMCLGMNGDILTPGSGPRRPATATSRAARDPVAAPTSSRPG